LKGCILILPQPISEAEGMTGSANALSIADLPRVQLLPSNPPKTVGCSIWGTCLNLNGCEHKLSIVFFDEDIEQRLSILKKKSVWDLWQFKRVAS